MKLRCGLTPMTTTMEPLLIKDNKSDRRVAQKIRQLLRRDDSHQLSFLVAQIHPDSVLNSKGQTGLHLACKMGHANCVKVFLRQGASKRFRDNNGNIPLHFAAKFCMKQTHRFINRDLQKMMDKLVTKPFLDDLELLKVPNKKGTTPKILLDALNKTIYFNESGSSSDDDWEMKIREEEEEEHFQHFGKFQVWGSDSFTNAFNETYDQWADRIYAEFSKRQKTHHRSHSSKPKNDELAPPCPSKKIKLFNPPKDSSFKSKIDNLFEKDSLEPIRAKDLPFDENTPPEKIINVLLNGITDCKVVKDVIRTWHPDKFNQMFYSRIDPGEKDKTLRIITKVSQALLNFGR